MIAFLDIEVYALEKDLLHKEDIDIYFSAEEHKEDILLIYEEGRYYGLICYQSFMNDRDSLIVRQNENYIIREKYIHKADDESLWDNLRDVFKRTGVVYVPVFDEMGNLLYFAYDNRSNKEERLRNCLESLIQCSNPGFFDHMDSKIKGVRIYDFNELGFLFWKIAEQKCHMPVETVGEKWRAFYPQSQSEKESKKMPKQNIVEYYPQSDPLCLIINEQDKKEIGLSGIIRTCLEGIIEDNKKQMIKKKIAMLTAYFEVAYLPKTADEEYRNLMQITPSVMTQHEWNQPLIYEQICKVEGSRISYEEWRSQYKKKEWEFININGKSIKKKTVGKGKNIIYLIGPCIAGGNTVKCHEESLGACLCRRLEEMGFSYSVIYICIDMRNLDIYEKIFSSLMLSENDIILAVIRGSEDAASKSDIPISKILEKRTGDWFYNHPMHTNYVGNQKLAREIVDNYLAPLCREAKEDPEYLQVGKEFLSKEENAVLENYIAEVRSKRRIEFGKHIGAIIMNCNPMTKGHYYLIEEARKRVDYLYVFVVQENRSEFSFEERFDIVAAETAQMENVIVVPSGKFVLSYSTMPLYFEKEEKKDATLDATNDLRIFGQCVASALRITERFVGEEPIDMVTRQYNDEMKKILPLYNIKVTEIPRIKMGDAVISASRVRALMKEERWEELQDLVTEGVYKRLREREESPDVGVAIRRI